MDLLYKNNTMKINDKIAELKSKKLKREKRIRTCDSIFMPLSTSHILAAGIYGTVVVVQAITNNMVIPMYFASPIAISIISSCSMSLGINAIVKTVNENKKENIEKQIRNYVKMLDKYNTKPVKQNFKDMTKNIRSKQQQETQRIHNFEYANMYELEEGQKLSLRK